MGTVQHIEKTDPMHRELNKGLMVRWINGDLIERANHDVRKSIVLYDDDQTFVGALPAVLGPVLTDELQDKLYSVGVRYYSNGIV
ncbi:gp49 [Mycobacterium phage Barnyard]|uniref:Uncharacterized protein n=1 Tax=Mycobacterium phage Barnyard TaxID=205880 RepID=Q856C3_9CAUD|nr:gp49 [Mycobacterium phage Barnyard]AAN02103.1 hypothetical protein PBI_BARNYARD_49 [Mycobacterium phage Barnyard]